MKLERLILGLLLLPLVIAIFVILFPLILIFGIIALFLRGNTVRTFVKTKTLRSQTSEPNREDDVSDVEVIRSEDIGEKNDISGRSLR